MSASVQIKQCNRCLAKLPLQDFVLSKYSKDGYGPCCKLCHSQTFRLRRKAKYVVDSPIDDSIIRYVQDQNRMVIAYALPLSTCEVVAFDPVYKRDYKVFFGLSASLGMKAVCVFDHENKMLRELAYSGEVQQIEAEILSFLKSLNLRLELSSLHAMASKNVIYYI